MHIPLMLSWIRQCTLSPSIGGLTWSYRNGPMQHIWNRKHNRWSYFSSNTWVGAGKYQMCRIHSSKFFSLMWFYLNLSTSSWFYSVLVFLVTKELAKPRNQAFYSCLKYLLESSKTLSFPLLMKIEIFTLKLWGIYVNKVFLNGNMIFSLCFSGL